MNLIIRQIIVMVITFLIILWFQNKDDIKHNKIRITLYDKYKLPLLVSTIIGLIINFSLFFKITECPPVNKLTEINILTPINEIRTPTHTNLKDIINNLQISTDMPDF